MYTSTNTISFYGETDQEHTEAEYQLELDNAYRLHRIYFGQEDGQVEPNYLEYSKNKGRSELQHKLLEKVYHLAKAGVVMSVQDLTESLEVYHPLTTLCTLENLAQQGLINNFSIPLMYREE